MQSPKPKLGFTWDQGRPERHLMPENSLPSSNPSESSSSLFSIASASPRISGSSVSFISASALSVNEARRPWWDVQATAILEGCDLRIIGLLCKYGTYRPENFLDYIRTRSAHTLNSCLLNLGSESCSQGKIDTLGWDEKFQEISKRLVPCCPVAHDLESYRFPELHDPDASIVASNLDKKSLFLFERIRIPDYVRLAFDPLQYVETVEAFVDWHNSLVNEILERLNAFPKEMCKYAQVKQVRPAATMLLLR